MPIMTEKYNPGKEFPYVFFVRGVKDRLEMKTWLMENIGLYKFDWFWWGTYNGNPCVYIREVESATAFKLAWL